MSGRRLIIALLAGTLVATSAVMAGGGAGVMGAGGAYEVWIVDQSDTTADGGGTLYVYDGDELNGKDAGLAVPEVVDLGGAARDLQLANTGTPGRRPHMMFFNAAQTHAILAYVATGHVLFIDTATRQPVGVVDVGVQAHSAFPAPDDSYVLVANQNGKLIQRIRTDYASNQFILENDATLDLANGTTPSGALRQDPLLRPDNAPICLGIDSSSRYGHITLRGGGMFIVDCSTTPMQIVAEYDRATIHPTGCVALEVGEKMYLVSGTGVDPLGQTHADLYSIMMHEVTPTPAPPNQPTPQWVLSDDGGAVDSHGAVPTKDGRYLWMADRFGNRMTVIDTATDTVASRFSLNVPGLTADAAPDLLERSPGGNRIFASLRGPAPLTGNNPVFNNAVGSTPGLGIFQVTNGGKTGKLAAIARISHMVNGVERADPHAIAVRQK
jgi:hypothetical protein